MKQLRGDRIQWLQRRQIRSARRLYRMAGEAKQYLYKNGVRYAQSSPISTIRVPKSLGSETEEQRVKIQECISLAMQELELGKRVRLDFTATQKAFPGGMLMLLAYVELMNEFFPSRVTAVSPPGALITQLLQHFGFAERLAMNCGGTKPSHSSVLNWRYSTGTQADGEKITDLLEAYKAVSGSEIPQGLYDVLAEALTNVRHHAYPAEDVDPPEPLRKWWLFSQYTSPSAEKLGSLTIAVYDIGVGIQTSLRKKLQAGEVVLDATDEILKALSLGDANYTEKLLLKRAIEEERSSTGLSFRGNGLPEMRDFVMGTNSGRMYITSGRAQYSCIAATRQSEVFGCKSEFLGTLLVWAIPLNAPPQELSS